MRQQTHRPTGYLRRKRHSASIELTVESTVQIRPDRIGFASVASPAGPLMIAATEGGLCWIGIHDSVEYLESELRNDYPRAEIFRDDARIDELADRVISEINQGSGPIELPLDIRATPFQLAVWRELCAIPRGAMRSYGEIAQRLGRPEASRAVGHANGSNPLAVIIPCHRAIGSDGSLTGYRWGLEYKRRLLEHERALAQMTLGAAPQSATESDPIGAIDDLSRFRLQLAAKLTTETGLRKS